MDENVRAGLLVAAAVLGFGGGLLTFLNGRLNEAKSDEAKSRVYGRLRATFYYSLIVAAILSSFVHPLLPIPLSIGAYAVLAHRFLGFKHPLSRREVFALTAITACYVVFIMMMMMLHYFVRIVSILEVMAK